MFDDAIGVEYKGQIYLQAHGSPFDRGSADSYYHRGRDPHWWPQGTSHGNRVEAVDMSADEIAAYHAGYDYNEQFGDKKNWG